jgi:hypothetical protein
VFENRFCFHNGHHKIVQLIESNIVFRFCRAKRVLLLPNDEGDACAAALVAQENDGMTSSDIIEPVFAKGKA